jgi:hypothetical protein
MDSVQKPCNSRVIQLGQIHYVLPVFALCNNENVEIKIQICLHCLEYVLLDSIGLRQLDPQYRVQNVD